MKFDIGSKKGITVTYTRIGLGLLLIYNRKKNSDNPNFLRSLSACIRCSDSVLIAHFLICSRSIVWLFTKIYCLNNLHSHSKQAKKKWWIDRVHTMNTIFTHISTSDFQVIFGDECARITNRTFEQKKGAKRKAIILSNSIVTWKSRFQSLPIEIGHQKRGKNH